MSHEAPWGRAFQVAEITSAKAQRQKFSVCVQGTEGTFAPVQLELSRWGEVGSTLGEHGGDSGSAVVEALLDHCRDIGLVSE